MYIIIKVRIRKPSDIRSKEPREEKPQCGYWPSRGRSAGCEGYTIFTILPVILCTFFGLIDVDVVTLDWIG